MVTILAKRTPLTESQLAFLSPYITRKRMKETAVKNEDDSDKKLGEEVAIKEVSLIAEEGDKTGKSAQLVEKNGNKSKETDTESALDIANQIKILQERLESLRKEKHSLFQQLKLVLHDEDERKRVKEEEQKLELEKSMPSGDVYDPRAQLELGMKRPYSSMLSSSYPGGSPLKRQQRGPLLPTPDGASPGPFSRQGSGGSFHSPSETFHSGSKPLFSPRGQAVPGSGVQRPPFHERVGHAYKMPHEMQLQGAHPSLDPPMITRPHQNPQSSHSVPYAQAHPSPHDLQTQYTGMQVTNFQYTPSPSPYGSVSNIHGPSGPGQPVQMQYPQGGSQVGFVQQHAHEMHYSQPIQQPHPHDIPMQSHPHYGPLAGQVMGGHPHGEHLLGGTTYPSHLHDPRHQKLVADHQLTGSGLKSPVSLQSPLYS